MPGYLGGTSAVANLAYRDQLHEVRCPTHIICAGADPVTPIEKSREIHDRIAGSKLEIVEGQHHFSNVEVPNTFNAILLAGLEEMVADVQS